MAAGLHLFASAWALPELIEAAARSGNAQVATDALHRLAEMTQAGGTDFGLGLEALAKISPSSASAPAASCTPRWRTSHSRTSRPSRAA